MLHDVLITLMMASIVSALASLFGYLTNLTESEKSPISPVLRERCKEEAYRYAGIFWLSLACLVILIVTSTIINAFNQ